jgi:hypothetical protein
MIWPICSMETALAVLIRLTGGPALGCPCPNA